jgi:Chitin binding Peritrophin-A domain
VLALIAASDATFPHPNLPGIQTPVAPVLPAEPLENPCLNKPNNYFVENVRAGCDSYFVCFRGLATPLRCSEGLYFDIHRQMCYHAEEVRCRRDRCVGRKENSFVARPGGGCDAYARCENGRGVELKCPVPFYFNEETQMCDWATNVRCTPSPCLGRENYSYLTDYSGHCGSFLMCLDGEAIKEECPNNLYFDEPNQICNYPELVNCRRR